MYSASLVNEKLYVGYDSSKLEIWDGNSLSCKSTLEIKTPIMKIATLAADSQYILCAGQNGNIMIISAKTHQIYSIFNNEENVEKQRN